MKKKKICFRSFKKKKKAFEKRDKLKRNDVSLSKARKKKSS